MSADPNPPAPAPTGDHPTWTNFYDERARQRLTHVPSPGKDHWADRYAVDVSHLLGRITELDAALVEAVHRSQQLDAAVLDADLQREAYMAADARARRAEAVIEAVRQWGPDAQMPRRVARALAAYDAAPGREAAP